MRTFSSTRSLIVLATIGLMAAGEVAHAEHFRGAAFMWQRSTTTLNAVEFRIIQALQASELEPNTQVGDLFTEEVFDFGDGTTAPLTLTITGIDRELDLAVGEAVLEHVYADGTGSVTAGFSACCRDAELDGRGGQPYVVAAQLEPLGGVDAPRHGIPQVVAFLPQPRAARAIPVVLQVDHSVGDVRCRLATAAEMGGGTDPVGVYVSPTCVLTWDTAIATAGEYPIQIRVERFVDGVVRATSISDLVVSLASNRAPLPTCSFSPASPIPVNTGESTTITISASGLSGNSAGLLMQSEPVAGAGVVTYGQGSGMGTTAEYTLRLAPGDLDGLGFLNFLVGDKNALSSCAATIDPLP